MKFSSETKISSVLITAKFSKIVFEVCLRLIHESACYHFMLSILFPLTLKITSWRKFEKHYSKTMVCEYFKLWCFGTLTHL